MKRTRDSQAVEARLGQLQSYPYLMWVNFTGGVIKGFLVAIGLALIFAAAIWIVAHLAAMPVVGEYFDDIKALIVEFSERSDYTGELNRLRDHLAEIRDNTAR
jgi:hypothetical protein